MIRASPLDGARHHRPASFSIEFLDGTVQAYAFTFG